MTIPILLLLDRRLRLTAADNEVNPANEKPSQSC